MNHKFLKNLKLYCKVKGESYEVWKMIYSVMPGEIKKNFKRDISEFVKDYREYRKSVTN